MWYWGEAGRQWLGQVIVVGADNAYVPKLLGWETARSMNEALEMAKGNTPSPGHHAPAHAPILMADVTVPAAVLRCAASGSNGAHVNGHGVEA